MLTYFFLFCIVTIIRATSLMHVYIGSFDIFGQCTIKFHRAFFSDKYEQRDLLDYLALENSRNREVIFMQYLYGATKLKANSTTHALDFKVKEDCAINVIIQYKFTNLYIKSNMVQSTRDYARDDAIFIMVSISASSYRVEPIEGFGNMRMFLALVSKQGEGSLQTYNCGSIALYVTNHGLHQETLKKPLISKSIGTIGPRRSIFLPQRPQYPISKIAIRPWFIAHSNSFVMRPPAYS